MCILYHTTQLINNIEQECSWEKPALIPFLFSFSELLKTRIDDLSIRIHHQIENLIFPELRTSLLFQILLCASIRIINRPFSADFDGDCVHIYYPQSLAAEVEALELFSVENQLICSHSGMVNLQLGNDSLVAMKLMSFRTMLSKKLADQLAMFIPSKKL